MGLVLSVEFEATVKDEAGAINAMKQKIERDMKNGTVDYSLEKNLERGVGTETLEDLIRIFLSGTRSKEEVVRDGNHITFQSDFDASYGWERVMLEMYDEIIPYLEPGSSLNVEAW